RVPSSTGISPAESTLSRKQNNSKSLCSRDGYFRITSFAAPGTVLASTFALCKRLSPQRRPGETHWRRFVWFCLSVRWCECLVSILMAALSGRKPKSEEGPSNVTTVVCMPCCDSAGHGSPVGDGG